MKVEAGVVSNNKLRGSGEATSRESLTLPTPGLGFLASSSVEEF